MSQDKVQEYYTNDIVYKFDKNKKIVIGVVIDLYDGSNDDFDFHGSPALQKGQIRVSTANGDDNVWRQDKVHLLNRGIVPGDIVRRFEKGKETQRGYCKEIKQIASVQIVGTEKVIEHVSGDRLHNVRPFDLYDAVCVGKTFGRINNIEQLFTMQSKDGSIVELFTSIDNDIEDYWMNRKSKSYLDIFYPGQEVICNPANLEQPNWIRKSKTMKKIISMHQSHRFTIQHVTEVVCEISSFDLSTLTFHNAEILKDDFKNMKVLEYPSSASFELTRRRLLKLNSHDVLIKKKDWIRKLSAFYRPEVPKVRHVIFPNYGSKSSISRIPRIRSSSLIVATTPTAELNNPLLTFSSQCDQENVEGDDDEWWTDEEGEESEEDTNEVDSGTSSQSASLIGNKSIVKKRHFPPKPNELTPGHTLGVEIIGVESKCTIVWQDGSEEKDIPSTQLYYSVALDDHEFFPGEWVMRDAEKSDKFGVVQKVDYMERTATVKWFILSEDKKILQSMECEELSVYDLRKHPSFIFRPGSIVIAKPTQENKMGKVIDSCIEGYVAVQWLDGKRENLWPQDIELMPDTDDYDYSESGDTSDSWETTSIESLFGGDISDEKVLQNMAARLDFVRSRIVYLKEAFKNHTITENFAILKDLLLVYENSSYLDRVLSTSFFSFKSKHFQALLAQAKEKAKSQNIELRGRLFSNDRFYIQKYKTAEADNIKKMIKLENKVNEEIEKNESINKEPNTTEPTTPSTPITPDSIEIPNISQDDLCVELLSTLKLRMDLAYAEIISRIGGIQALTTLTKATEGTSTPTSSTPLPSYPVTPDESFLIIGPFNPNPKPKKCTTRNVETAEELPPPYIGETDWYLESTDTPISHNYYSSKLEPTDGQKFLKAVMKEYKLLKESLPSGVWVRTFSDRVDLLSVMIRGPAKTPYEDGLFIFDMQLSPNYPRTPPFVHYLSYSLERLNPNLYVEGKVCVSLLGTWMGKGSEVWGPNSTLLQLIVSIQGLILVSEPYYNEAGYEKQTDTQIGYENSRTYNELVILKLVQSMTQLLVNPPRVFYNEILTHFAQNGEKLCQRLELYCSDNDILKPEFPLLPVSKGLKLSLSSALKKFRDTLAEKVNLAKKSEDAVVIKNSIVKKSL